MKDAIRNERLNVELPKPFSPNVGAAALPPSPDIAVAHPRLARFTPIDALFAVYNAVLLVLTAAASLHRPEYAPYALGHALGLALLAAIVRWQPTPGCRLGLFLRHGYPVILFAFLHYESGTLNQLIFSGYFDAQVRAWDRAVFGLSLHEHLASWCDSRIVDELLHLAYFSYYALVAVPPIILAVQGRSRDLREFVFLVSFVLLVCYVIFIAFPVVGPTHLHAHLFADAPAVSMVRLMEFITAHGDNNGGAMPSSHVAVALGIPWLAARYWGRRTLPPLIVLTAALVVSTVYSSYHYAIDAVAGLVAGVLLYAAGHAVWRRSQEAVEP